MEELRKDFTEFFCRELLSYDGNAQKFTDNIWGWVVTKIKQAKLDSMKKQDMQKIAGEMADRFHIITHSLLRRFPSIEKELIQVEKNIRNIKTESNFSE